MLPLHGHKVLLGVTGGIASYKSATLARRLIDAGAEVRVVMSAGAQAFIQPLTFQALTGNPVHTHLLDTEAEAAMGHIQLARWADHILIAPASANTLARLAHGFADDLLSTLCLATDSAIHVAPAMNRLMWANPATQENCRLLRERNVTFFGPDEGLQACGETGAGRMQEPEAIRDALILKVRRSSVPRLTSRSAISPSPPVSKVSGTGAANQPNAQALRDATLAGLHLLITAGPTREAIDPVRYISNHSSGKMGFALAAIASARGAEVTLVAGPVSLDTPHGVKRINVTTAEQMRDAVIDKARHCDVFIAVAAVADYRLNSVAEQKMKKTETGNESLNLALVPNPDILKEVSMLPDRPFCVGFAAETENVLEHARAKLKRKNLDLIAANKVGQADNPVFGSDTNAVDVLWGDDGHARIDSAPKREVAAALLDLMRQRLEQAHARRQ